MPRVTLSATRGTGRPEQSVRLLSRMRLRERIATMGQLSRGKGSYPRAKSRHRNRADVRAGPIRATCGRPAARARPAAGADRGRRRGRFRRGRNVSGAGRRRRRARRVRCGASSRDRRPDRAGRTAHGCRPPQPRPPKGRGCRRPPPRQAPCPAGGAHRWRRRPPREGTLDGASTVDRCVVARQPTAAPGRRVRSSRCGRARRASAGFRSSRGSSFGSPCRPVAAGH